LVNFSTHHASPEWLAAPTPLFGSARAGSVSKFILSRVGCFEPLASSQKTPPYNKRRFFLAIGEFFSFSVQSEPLSQKILSRPVEGSKSAVSAMNQQKKAAPSDFGGAVISWGER
jgi:hypothetical protein